MPPPAVVLDTNVVVSATLKPQGREALILTLALEGELRLLVSEPILWEYERVLPREKFRVDAARLSALLELIRKAGHWLHPVRDLSEASDPSDNRFLECAEAGEADYLVTGNRRHFPKRWGRTQVVNARGLLEIIGPALKES